MGDSMSDINEKEIIGTVLVIGGGIAGMQSAMDLAESGFKVYLADKQPAIGGRMAQLDKTFPTNDCAMCIMAPRLIDMSENDNIELVTCAELNNIEGEAGNFTAYFRKHPRYVDEEKCNSCGKCIEACTVMVNDEFNEAINERKAIYRLFPQAVPDTFAVDKLEIPRCRATCPIHTNVQGYVSLIANGKFAEAYQVNKEVNPFPSICGRVCDHPCERECLRNNIDEPVTITFLKRAATDYVMQNNLAEELEPVCPPLAEDARKVAIIGSGPAGLAAANDLAMLGYKATVFESLPVAGGMMAVGIPEFRLPKDVLQKEIGSIQKKGVEIQLNTRLGRDITLTDLLEREYESIYLAIGAHSGRQLRIEGEDLPQVVEAVDFLRRVNLDEEVEVPAKVMVVGGGNVAIDAARCSLRQGASEITILYRRSKEEMPADEWEVEEAEEEGIKIQFLTNPTRITGEDGKVTSIECIRMELGEPDESGRRRPIPVQGSEFTMPVDMIIKAIGQAPESDFLSEKEGLELNEVGTIKVDPNTFTTNIPGIFAGGDAVTGPKTVVEAIAAGKKAARAIHKYLNKEDLATPMPWETKTRELSELKSEEYHNRFEINPTERQEIPRLSVSERINNFNEVQQGFDFNAAIEQAKRCLNCAICSDCHECVKVCDPEAIDHEMGEEMVSLNVGSIILSAGYDTTPAEAIGEYGYGRYPNVITSLEFERYLSASGPTLGQVIRPSDREEPKRIAFIQCVGSRDITGRSNEYCCSVGCMYAIKQAVIAQEHAPGVDITIFFIDMRAHGKGYEDYYIRAEEEYGVRCIRSSISTVKEIKQTENLLLRYVDEAGKTADEEFDLVVLTVGLQRPLGFVELSDAMNIERNEYGLCKTELFSSVNTSRGGIYVCGSIQEPKDIPYTVVQASAAASYAGELLAPARGTMIVEKEYPPERDILNEPPRIGVFVCHCGRNIAGVVDVEDASSFAAELNDVVYTQDVLFTCSPDGLDSIKKAIVEHQLNRVVVASCSPRTHEPLFRETLREVGINRYLFEMANIRDQCSWVHAFDHDAATDKSKKLIGSAVAKARLLEPLERMLLPNIQKGLVIGGGLAGMEAALSLAEQGFPVHLVEKQDVLGGHARHLRYTLEGVDVQQYLNALTEKVENHPLIDTHLSSEVVESTGFIGNFSTRIQTSATDEDNAEPLQQIIEHGVIILATGAQEYQPKEYGYGESENVITQQELENRIADGTLQLPENASVVMIQCVGCRNEERTYCSRICCSMAVKNSLKIKESNPDANVYVLYKDIRTFGFREKYYQQARQEGITFIRYDDEHNPQVSTENGSLNVTVNDLFINEEYTFDANLVALSAAIISGEDNENINKMLMVPQGEYGFFLEAHIKLRPVEFASEGMFLCGMAHSPKFASEAIVQAKAAASRAATILSKPELMIEGIVSVVNEDKCVACLTCVRVCPYQVPAFNSETGVVEIEPAKCHGCGICASECPAKAIHLRQFKDEYVLEMIDALLLE